MRSKNSKPPTAEEWSWMEACKSGPCVACYNRSGGRLYRTPCDGHHLLSGGRRRGHMALVGLCGWCHRRIPDEGWSIGAMLDWLGPSLMDGSKLFHADKGSNSELLELQKKINEGEA